MCTPPPLTPRVALLLALVLQPPSLAADNPSTLVYEAPDGDMEAEVAIASKGFGWWVSSYCLPPPATFTAAMASKAGRRLEPAGPNPRAVAQPSKALLGATVAHVRCAAHPPGQRDVSLWRVLLVAVVGGGATHAGGAGLLGLGARGRAIQREGVLLLLRGERRGLQAVAAAHLLFVVCDVRPR